MIWHVARRELLDHVQSVRFVVLFLLTLALMPVGAYVNGRNYETRHAYYESLRAAQRDKMQTPDVKPHYGFTWDGFEDEALRAPREPAPLSVFAIGDDATMPAYWQFATGGLREGSQPAVYEGLAGLLGDVDFLFLTQVVLGLLAVLLVFDSICGDRENGTLRAVLAHSVPRTTLLAGKYLGGMITLLLPLLLGLLTSLLVLQIMGLEVTRGELVARIALMAVGGALYVSCLLGIGLLVSATTQHQRNALVALLVAWVVLVLLVPRIGALLATGLVPVDTEEVAQRRKSLAVEAIEDERQRLLTVEARRAFDWHSEEPPWRMLFEELTEETRNARLDDYEAARARIERDLFRHKRQLIQEHAAERERELLAQQRVAGLLGRVSPAPALGFLASELAGTGRSTLARWEGLARQHQTALEQALFDRTAGVEVHFGDGRWRNSDARASDVPIPGYDELPSFEYRPPSLGASVRAAAPDFALLVVYNVLALGAAALAFSRYDVR